MEKIIVQITSGKGPAECAWVVAQLLKSLLKEWVDMGLEPQVQNRVKGSEHRTLNSVSVIISGKDLKELKKDYEGSYLWVGRSPYRKFHKRKNWFVGVSCFPPLKEQSLDRKSLAFQTFRGSGPGGQAVNKLETAVRVTHIPSGVTATSREARSQLENRKIALKRLEEKFIENRLNDMIESASAQWEAHASLERGSPIRVYEGEKFRLKRK